MQLVGKSKPWFRIQKNPKFIFATLLEFLMSQIFHRKQLDDFRAANMTKITTNVKKGEVGIVEQWSFVGWKYGPCREKKLKIALLKKTAFKVKFKFKVENRVLQISVRLGILRFTHHINMTSKIRDISIKAFGWDIKVFGVFPETTRC